MSYHDNEYTDDEIMNLFRKVLNLIDDPDHNPHEYGSVAYGTYEKDHAKAKLVEALQYAIKHSEV